MNCFLQIFNQKKQSCEKCFNNNYEYRGESGGWEQNYFYDISNTFKIFLQLKEEYPLKEKEYRHNDLSWLIDDYIWDNKTPPIKLVKEYEQLTIELRNYENIEAQIIYYKSLLKRYSRRYSDR